MNLWNRSVLAILALTCTGAPSVAGFEIKERNLRRHVEYLADDARRGREAGAPEISDAEGYIAERFREAGLLPLPGSLDYFSKVHLYRSGFDADETGVQLEVDGKSLVAQAGRDFRPFPFSDSGSIEGEVVFAGYGITAEELEYDDYAGLDVEGKIVFLFRHEPGENDPNSNFDGTESTQHATFAAKARNAQEKGAIGMILVTDPLHHDGPDDLRLGRALRLDPPPMDSGTAEEADGEDLFLAVQVSREVAERIARTTGRSLADMQTHIEEGGVASELSLEKVRASIQVREHPDAELVLGRNVVGWLEGSDPHLRHEIVVVGAHHDHVGAFHGHGDTIFNGADDNASGTSALIELARVFARPKNRPARSLLFVTFTAEEKGLLGSRALVEQERIPVDRIVFMLNLDMIGRNPDRPVQIFGDGYVAGLKGLVESASQDLGLELDYAGDGYAGNSDHDAFYRKDIPFMFPFTGTHEDYHQLGDHVEKLSYERMTRIATLAQRTVAAIANAPEPPRFVHHISWLGIQVEPNEVAAVVTAVQEGSRAEKAGIRDGDRITAVAGESLEAPTEVGRRFRAIEPGTETSLEIDRAGSSKEIQVVRARRGYLGVFPGDPSEEQRQEIGISSGEGVLIRQAVEDGPAMKSGIQEGDVLLQIAGRPIGTRTLGAVLAQIGAGEEVDVLLYREGERITLQLVLGERPQRR